MPASSDPWMPSALPLLPTGRQRILSLHFPHLPTDRIARSRWGMSWRSIGRPEGAPPLVCTDRVQNAMRLTALDAAAEALGLKPLQGLAEAKAICPSLDTVMADAMADTRFLAAIADWCDRYTPLVAIDGKDGLLLDIAGCAHLFGGEQALLADVLDKLCRFGLDARGAIAGTPSLAYALARNRGGIVEDGEAETALAPLPVALLRLAPETVARLAKLGLRQVGDLIALPRAPLTRRFGPQVVLRLDQALGREDEPISPRRPLARLSVERRLAEPVTGQDDLLGLSAKLAVALKPQLEIHGLGGRLFELLLFRVDGQVFRLHAGASSPLREPKRIAALFSERFQAVHDDLDAGFGFEILRLNVLHADAFSGTQQDFSGAGASAASLDAFIDQAVARFGADCLLLPVARASHLPERAGLLRPVFETRAAPESAVGAGTTLPRLERPFRLFARPEPVEASAPVPDGPPIRFRWRRALHQVLRAEGPERIGAEWWIDGEDAPPRDYFRIEDESGRRYWLFREGLYGAGNAPRWFMHGVFA